MINFIIFENEEYYKDLYKKVIKKFFYTLSRNYEISTIHSYSKKLESDLLKLDEPLVFFIEINTNKLKIARRICSLFGENTFIVLFNNKKVFNYLDYKNIIPLAVIEKDNNIIKNIFETLNMVYVRTNKYKTYNFSYYDEIHRINYDDIYYFQKELNTNCTTIFTRDNTYFVYSTIKDLDKIFSKDPRFFKSHRSCIVNLSKIVHFDAKMNTIIFDNDEVIDLVCRRRKKILQERLLKSD